MLTPRPALPLLVALAILPLGAVLQFRAIAPGATVALLLTVLAARLAKGSWPWPRGALPVAALGLVAWLTLSALWAPEPWRVLDLGLRLAAFMLLGAMAARALSELPPERLAPLPWVLAGGLAAGALAALADQASGHALRAAARGWTEIPWRIVFGLKPAVSVLAVLLPLAVFAPALPRLLRAGLAALGLAAAFALPAESARLAMVAGLLLGLAARAAGSWVARALGGALALGVLAAPWLMAGALALLPSLERLPPSAAHRVLTWDFVLERIAEKPLLGWGAEASRVIPGGRDGFDEARLSRFGLTSESSRAWFARPEAQALPLHPHNMALQLWLDLGLPGALLGAALAWLLGVAAARARPPAAATGALAAAIMVGLLSYGAWQEWWIGLMLLLVAALAAGSRITSGKG
ncbi:O-antigen ligase family protein [Rubritepida flocculans]|uniref:O-antigen ligase family protein n=1 Tax=Rubritepida flocculans TaxID=182403 RepID=UPI0003FB8FDD|nr:O-antigen ligase family protein [Rubritepida flocculans]